MKDAAPSGYTVVQMRLMSRMRAELEKVPYTLVLGAKEAEAQAVSVRSRARGDEGVIPFAPFLERLQGEIRNRTLPDKKKAVPTT